MRPSGVTDSLGSRRSADSRGDPGRRGPLPAVRRGEDAEGPVGRDVARALAERAVPPVPVAHQVGEGVVGGLIPDPADLHQLGPLRRRLGTGDQRAGRHQDQRHDPPHGMLPDGVERPPRPRVIRSAPSASLAPLSPSRGRFLGEKCPRGANIPRGPRVYWSRGRRGGPTRATPRPAPGPLTIEVGDVFRVDQSRLRTSGSGPSCRSIGERAALLSEAPVTPARRQPSTGSPGPVSHDSRASSFHGPVAETV